MNVRPRMCHISQHALKCAFQAREGTLLDIEVSFHECRGRNFRNRGMTLVEILAVVVILGLLAGTLLVGFSGSFGMAKHELARSGIGVIVNKLETYRIEHGEWPDNTIGLAALSNGHATPQDAYYLSTNQLRDPWNHRYYLVIPGPGGYPYEIISYGADGQPGGEPGSEDQDISSIDLRGKD